MSKRTASSELNHDNWCEEDEPEAAGVFQRASADALKERKFRTARRRGVVGGTDATNESGDQSGGKSIFAGFGGFKKAEPVSAKAVFSFLAAPPNGSSSKPETSTSELTSSAADNEKKPVNGVDSVSETTPKSNDYYRRLKGLNESVAKWISTHVANNPLIILTPVFRDYEKHLASIQGKDDDKSSETSSNLDGSKQTVDDGKKIFCGVADQTSSPVTSDKEDNKPKAETKPFTGSIFGSTSNTTSATTANFSFGSSGTNNQTQPQFCFGSPNASNTTGSAVTYSFGSGSTSSPSAGFSFGAGKPFTFSNVASNNTDEKKEDENEEEEDDSPPKPDHKPVNEEGATYTKRCKVFIKQEKEYSDRGIGNLFLKPVNGGKMQLIVRADTSLGNVLLNFLVGSSLPIQRIGTNNVAVVCLPTPDSKPPPVTVLLRVKTSDDADELFNTLEKHKKEAA